GRRGRHPVRIGGELPRPRRSQRRELGPPRRRRPPADSQFLVHLRHPGRRHHDHGALPQPDRRRAKRRAQSQAQGSLMAVPLEVRGLGTTLFTRRGTMKAVDGISLTVGAGETVALVGESGCGKSLTALSIMRLLPDPPARIVGGAVKLNGRDIVAVPEETMLDIRGKEIGMIFQDPMSSLNPVATVEKQIAEVLMTHTALGRGQARVRAHELLEQVGMPDAGRRLDAYPHQLSGGMCQRVVIAMAIACSPAGLIADEPTTALDVTVQAQVLTLLKRLQ